MGRRTEAAIPRYFNPAGLTRALVEITSRALAQQDCRDLADNSLAADTHAVGPIELGRVDSEAVATWIAGQYPKRPYPALVIGSPHGAAVQLAAALGAPWLPAGFDVHVRRPDGAAVETQDLLEDGMLASLSLAQANPTVSVRLVWNPLSRRRSAARTTHHYVRWRRLPQAYRRLLDGGLRGGGVVLLVRDIRTWPVWTPADRISCQIGTPTSGLDPRGYFEACQSLGSDWLSQPPDWRGAMQQYAETAVAAGFVATVREYCRDARLGLATVRYGNVDAFSAAAADIHRAWLRRGGKSGDRAVVGCGRLLDPHQATRAGLVPYWCENAARRAVTAAELWIAGSEPYTSVDVLPESPGQPWPGMATMGHWETVARFASRRGQVDALLKQAYPRQPLATRYATAVLRNHPWDNPLPAPLEPAYVVSGLRSRAELIVTTEGQWTDVVAEVPGIPTPGDDRGCALG